MDGIDLEVLARRLFEDSNDAIFFVDIESETITDVNPAGLKITGQKLSELRGRALKELLISELDEDQEILCAALHKWDFFHSRKKFFLQCRFFPLPVEVKICLAQLSTGALGLVIIRDVSERIRKERQLQDQRDRLKHIVEEKTAELRELNQSLQERVNERTVELNIANDELKAFAHKIAHDLRAPLRAVEGFATALAEDYGSQVDENGQLFIQQIIDASQRLDLLVNDLLLYNQLGHEELQIGRVDLNRVISKACQQLARHIEVSQAKIQIDDESFPAVLGHSETIVKITTSLLSNSIKFVAKKVCPEIRIWSEQTDQARIRIYFEDNGIGIENDFHQRIFEIFERLHGFEAYPGTGLGLAIVARGCQRLNGTCGVKSIPGQGSCFWIDFPLINSQANQDIANLHSVSSRKQLSTLPG